MSIHPIDRAREIANLRADLAKLDGLLAPLHNAWLPGPAELEAWREVLLTRIAELEAG